MIASCASEVRFEPGELLAADGAPADSFFFLRRGAVALELPVPNREPVKIGCVSAEDIVGWSWLVPPYEWRCDVRATEPVLATALDGSCIRSHFEHDPRLGYVLTARFLEIPTSRLRVARTHFVNARRRISSAA